MTSEKEKVYNEKECIERLVREEASRERKKESLERS